MPERLEKIKQWLAGQGIDGFDIAPASADASFRRYFRATPKDGTEPLIVMDAPPEQEDCAPFIHVTELMLDMGLHVPRILAQDLEQGFLLLSDLGSEQYLARLDRDSVEGLYGDALNALVTMQKSRDARIAQLPPYNDVLLYREMELFREWLLGKHLGLELDDETQAMLDETFDLLADNALAQPRVFVHRDYHSRNLMVTEPNPGILDYQDAVYGPVTYDLVSLLRDCYIAWPRSRVEDWVMDFYAEIAELPHMEDVSADEFLTWFDLMGVQRHLKASGIFARLNHRDGKEGYLKDIPRTLNYILQVADDTPRLEGLALLIEEEVMPQLGEAPAV